MTPLDPRTPVSCPKYAGNPSIPAECCVMRTFWTGTGRSRKKAAYPLCADCVLGRLRRQKLEAGGWKWDPEAWRKRNGERSRAGYRARTRLAATRGIDPLSAGK
jgi:hypothetical protein